MENESKNQTLEIGSRDKSVGWYIPTLDSITFKQRDLLESYSKIPHDMVIPTILQLRDSAWEIYPYPCVGQFHFIELSLCEHPSYHTVLQRLKNNNNILVDVGCCFGQDVRKLIHDGSPPSNTWGLELVPEFVDLGYELFNDSTLLPKSNMLKAGLFDTQVDWLIGKVNIVHASLFLHLFDWEGQKKACERLVQLLKNDKGVMVLGQQVGSLTPQHVQRGPIRMFQHNAISFESMWKEVGEATGTEWKVTASLDNGLNVDSFRKKYGDLTTRRLVFEVKRLQ